MQLNSELFGALQVISEDEGLMKKAVRSLKRIASQKKAADVNSDGAVNAVDASHILSYYAYTSTAKEKILTFGEYMKKQK